MSTLAEVLSPERDDPSVLTLNALLGTGTALAPALDALFLGLGVLWVLPVCVACALVALLLMTLKEPVRRCSPRVQDGKARLASCGLT